MYAPNLKLLGAKPIVPLPPTLPTGYRLTLETVDPREVADLLSDAFERDINAWAPAPDVFAMPVLFDPQGRLVGFCQLISPCFLHQFAIAPEVQMQGLGRRLFNWCVHTFHLPYVLISVDDTTTPAGHKFWAALGFREVGA